jgi:hypothetical protein
MADYAKREVRPDEIFKSKSSTSKGGPQRRLSPYEQMAIHNWRNFTPEGRRQVHNERFHGAALYGGPGTEAKVGSEEEFNPLRQAPDQMSGQTVKNVNLHGPDMDGAKPEIVAENWPHENQRQQEIHQSLDEDAKHNNLKGTGNVALIIREDQNQFLTDSNSLAWDIILVDNLAEGREELACYQRNYKVEIQQLYITQHGGIYQECGASMAFSARGVITEQSIGQYLRGDTISKFPYPWYVVDMSALEHLGAIFSMIDRDAKIIFAHCSPGSCDGTNNMIGLLSDLALYSRPDARFTIFINKDHTTLYRVQDYRGKQFLRFPFNQPLTQPKSFSGGWVKSQIGADGGYTIDETFDNLLISREYPIVTEIDRIAFLKWCYEIGEFPTSLEGREREVASKLFDLVNKRP